MCRPRQCRLFFVKNRWPQANPRASPLRFCPETCDGSNLRRLRLGLRGTASTNPSEANPSCAISFAFEVCPVAASFGLRLRILGAKYGSVSFAIKVPIQILGTQIDLGSVRRHIEFGRPQDS